MRGLHSCRLRLIRVILAQLWLSCKRCLNDTWVLCNVAGGPGCILIQSMESIGGLGAIALLKTTVSALLISDESVTLFSGWMTAVSHILTLNELSSIIIRCLTLEHELGVRFRWADGTRPRARVNSLRTHLRRHICRVLHEISGFAQIWISTSFDSSPLISENFTCVEHLVHDLIQVLKTREELIVEFRVSCWENSTEIFHAAEFLHCFSDQVSKSKLRAHLHCLSKLKILIFILWGQLVDQEFNLWVDMEVLYSNFIRTRLWNRYTTCKSMVSHISLRFTTSGSRRWKASVFCAEFQLV